MAVPIRDGDVVRRGPYLDRPLSVASLRRERAMGIECPETLHARFTPLAGIPDCLRVESALQDAMEP